MSIINVCPLNRDVRVGCLYDYNKDQILPEFFKITKENVDRSSHSPPTISSETITTDISEKERLSRFGIDHHLGLQLEAQKFEMNRLWFYNHLKDEAFCNCNSDNEFQIIVYLTFIRSTETLKESFINSNMWNYCDDQHSGTHLVEKVDYGAEFVLRLRKPIDPSKESKLALGLTMRIALKTYLKKYFNGICSPPPPNETLETMNCSFQSSIGNGLMYSGTFEQCLRQVQEMNDMEKNDRQNIWRPVAMQLRQIPTQLEIRIATNVFEDTASHIKEMQRWITQRCHCMLESPSFDRLPTLKKSLVEFQTIFEQITSTCNNIIDELQGKHYSPKQYELITQPYANLLKAASEWLTKYHHDVSKVASVLEGNNLQVLDLRSVHKPIKQLLEGKCTKVFVLHFACNTTDLDKRFKMWAKNPARDLFVFISYFFEEPNSIWERTYKVFIKKAIHSADNDAEWAVGIMSSFSPYREGIMVSFDNEEILRAALPNSPQLTSARGVKRCKQENSANG